MHASFYQNIQTIGSYAEVSSNKRLSKWQIIEKEKIKLSQAKKRCFIPYTKSLETTSKNAARTSKSLNYILSLVYRQSIKLEAALPSCLRPLGVTGSIKYLHEGKLYNTPQFAKLILAKNKKYQQVKGKNTVASFGEEFLTSFANNGLTLIKEMSRPSRTRTRYSCSELTKSQAIYLLRQGHYYLDRDQDGDPCE